jgi:hypothetical protein
MLTAPVQVGGWCASWCSARLPASHPPPGAHAADRASGCSHHRPPRRAARRFGAADGEDVCDRAEPCFHSCANWATSTAGTSSSRGDSPTANSSDFPGWRVSLCSSMQMSLSLPAAMPLRRQETQRQLARSSWSPPSILSRGAGEPGAARRERNRGHDRRRDLAHGQAARVDQGSGPGRRANRGPRCRGPPAPVLRCRRRRRRRHPCASSLASSRFLVATMTAPSQKWPQSELTRSWSS